MMPGHDTRFRALQREPAAIVGQVLERCRRVLLFGPPGSGKSTLAEGLGRTLAGMGRTCWCVSADPGSPAFGMPGAVSLAQWQGDAWRTQRFEALCTLDAGRFRLPLTEAVRALAAATGDGAVLIDGPGVVRGVAGAELLAGLVAATGVEAVLALVRAGRDLPLAQELGAAGLPVFVLEAAAEAMRPGKRVRARRRTAPWDQYLSAAVEHDIDVRELSLTGTPPPPQESPAWVGRQVGMLRGGVTVAMGEVRAARAGILSIALPAPPTHFDTLLVRDARRNTGGMIETAEPFAPERFGYLPAASLAPAGATFGGPRVTGRVGAFDVDLVNGVFGDPLLHVRVRHRRRSLLFDLGEAGRLPARLAHQVSDVFISHAHMDHIGGFLWLLRSRIGELPPCRLYGPPGLADHIEGLISGVLWDRVGERAPVFDVHEIHGTGRRCYRVQPGGRHAVSLYGAALPEGVILDEPEYRVEAVTLDHRTPVIAYALIPRRQINIRKDRLLARGLAPGPWLTELKRSLLAGAEDTRLELPDGTRAPAAALAAELAYIRPGKKLVYATDLADTADNRQRLTALARGAHTLFCEAPFCIADAERALRTGHLTTHACGEIAAAAGVGRLVPFHFSRRYADDIRAVYEEIKSVCNRVQAPGPALH